MAQAIGCDLCQQEAAVMMQSNLANGDTLGVGQACMVTFYAASLTTMLHDAPPEALNALSGVLVPLAAIIGPQERDTASDQVQAQVSGLAAAVAGVPGATLTNEAAQFATPQPGNDDDEQGVYEDGNTEYGIEQAEELNTKLAGE